QPLGLGRRAAARLPRRRIEPRHARSHDARHRRRRPPDGARRAHFDRPHRDLPPPHQGRRSQDRELHHRDRGACARRRPPGRHGDEGRSAARPHARHPGGSIRNPAGFCGTAGIKPTYGLVSRCGIFPLAFSLDTAGPLAWTVEDCALMLDVLAGYDPNDQASAKTAKVDYGAACHRPIEGMRIALARGWYEGKDSVTPEMKKAIDEAARVLKELGATIEDVAFPDIWDYHICGRVI